MPACIAILTIAYPQALPLYISLMSPFKASLLALFVGGLLASVSAAGIDFSHGSWQEVLDLARTEQKLIFVDAYAEWCGPCKMMARNTFTNDKVGTYFNEHFINYKFDMEKGEGPDFSSRYQISGYPTLLFIDHTGKVIHREMGYLAPSGLLRAGQTANKPQKNENLLQLRYEAGSKDPDVLYEYAKLLLDQGEDYTEVAARYFATQEERDLDEERNWKAIQAFTQDLHSREYRYLIDKRRRFSREYGTRPVAEKIYAVLKQSVIKAGLTRNREWLEDALEIAREELKDDGKTASRLRMVYAEAAKDWSDYAIKTIYFFETYMNTSALELDNAARNFIQHVDNGGQLETAANWCRQAIAIDNTYRTNATYAVLLHKMGQNEEARRQAYKALQLVPPGEEDSAEETKQLLRKLGEKVE